MKNDKIITLAKKLKALSERGIGGEKDNAQFQLEKLMKLHNISINDIEDEKFVSKLYRVGKFKNLFVQVAFSVGSDITIYEVRDSKIELIVDSTAEQAIEIQAKFDFFLFAYKAEQKKQEQMLFEAFVQKNRLFKNEASAEEKDLTPEEFEHILKVLKLADELEETPYFKQLQS